MCYCFVCRATCRATGNVLLSFFCAGLHVGLQEMCYCHCFRATWGASKCMRFSSYGSLNDSFLAIRVL